MIIFIYCPRFYSRRDSSNFASAVRYNSTAQATYRYFLILWNQRLLCSIHFSYFLLIFINFSHTLTMTLLFFIKSPLSSSSSLTFPHLLPSPFHLSLNLHFSLTFHFSFSESSFLWHSDFFLSLNLHFTPLFLFRRTSCYGGAGEICFCPIYKAGTRCRPV